MHEGKGPDQGKGGSTGPMARRGALDPPRGSVSRVRRACSASKAVAAAWPAPLAVAAATCAACGGGARDGGMASEE